MEKKANHGRQRKLYYQNTTIHGLKIPVDAECYESFVERVKTREQEFVKAFTEMQ